MVRRVVTGHKRGKATVLSDGVPARTHIFQKTKGLETAQIWSTPPKPQIVSNDEAESVHQDTTLLPRLGETRFMYLQIAPDSVVARPDFDAAAAGEEIVRILPEMAALMERDAPGMHRTESVDYVILLDGEIHLELDDQEEVLLKPHDVVVQIGTRHAWRNKSDRPALLAVVLIGARRRSSLFSG